MRPISFSFGRAAAGFSLVEVVVAVAVFLVGMLGVLELVSASRRINDQSAKRLQASVLAEGKLAVLRVAGYDALLADRASERPDLPRKTFRDVESMPGFAWRVSFGPAPGAPDALQARVSITWAAKDEDGKRVLVGHELTLTELIAKAPDGAGGES